jgi:hypothetical protein
MRSVRESIFMELTYQFTNKEITPWDGTTKFIHTELTRSDRALSQIFGFAAETLLHQIIFFHFWKIL